jgi:CBS-domain-containing membrane protein
MTSPSPERSAPWVEADRTNAGWSPGTFVEMTVSPDAHMLTVRDIMTTSVFTVEAEASAEEAAWGLTRRHIGGAPVRDSQGNVVGVLSKGDLVNPEPSQWIKGEATVGDLMNPDVLTVYDEDPALAAATSMAQRNIHRVVVLDEEQKMIGIVTSMDIVKAVAAGRTFAVETNDEYSSSAPEAVPSR